MSAFILALLGCLMGFLFTESNFFDRIIKFIQRCIANAFDDFNKMPPCKPPRSETINRIEVIDGEGRQFVKYLDNDSIVDLHYQDGGKTLKIFLKEKT